MLSERLLLWLSKPVPDVPPSLPEATGGPEDALALLRSEIPDLDRLVRGRRVADFGCGCGHQSRALVREYGATVVGIEANTATLARARALAAESGLTPERLHFVAEADDDLRERFDVVVSQNSFEHFDRPEVALSEMRGLLRSGGRMIITFGPPWMAPYGSHMQYFCSIPWLNLLFPERAVMRVRSRYRNDGATRYEEVESGLNKMTVRRFERIVAKSGMSLEFSRYRCVRGLDFLRGVPLARELVTNHLTVVLARE